MPRYNTAYACAGSSPTARLTHVVDMTRGVALCGRVHPDNVAFDPSKVADVATCPTCAKRDPRSTSGGPRSLSHLLSF